MVALQARTGARGEQALNTHSGAEQTVGATASGYWLVPDGQVSPERNGLATSLVVNHASHRPELHICISGL